MTETSYQVTGMTCAHCANAVTREVSDVHGVQSVDVSVETGTVVVAGSDVSDVAVRAAIDEAGYHGPMTSRHARDRARRPAGRRDDVCVLRRAGREEAQPARRGDRERQPRHRVGLGATTTPHPRRGHPDPDRRADRLHRGRRPRTRGPTEAEDTTGADLAPASRPQRRRSPWSCWCSPWRPVSPTRRPCPGSPLALATPVVLYGRLAVPPGRGGQRPPRRLARWTPSSRWARWSPTSGRSFQAVTGGMHSYFEVAATVTTFLLLGRWLRGTRQVPGRLGPARAARSSAPSRRPSSTTAAPSGWSTSPTSAPGCGSWSDPASRSPPTASCVEGRSGVDESMLTGESLPVEKAAGDEVVGATLNTDGRLVVEVTRIGRDTALARIAALVAARAGRQGPRPAAGRPDLGGVRPGRAGRRGAHLRRPGG